MKKEKVLFIGSFKELEGNFAGGQNFASRLLVNGLSESFNFITIDTTASTNLQRSKYDILINGLFRLSLFFRHLFFSDFTKAIVFSSHGNSLIEKGIYTIILSFLGKSVIFCPRSGLIINDLNKRPKFLKKVVDASDIIVCQSLFWKTLFLSNFAGNTEKYRVVYNCIELPQLSLLTERKVSKRLKLLFLGWVTREKGVFDLVDAVKELRKIGVDVELNIAGNGVDRDELLEYIAFNRMENCVNLMGWTFGKEKQYLFLESDALVLPSYFEGMPNVILEAMSYNLPVISTNISSIPEVVTPEVGYTFDAGNVNELIEILKTFSARKDDLGIVSSQGRNKLIQNHSCKNTIILFKQFLQ